MEETEMDILAARKELRKKTIYDLSLRVTYYARVSTDKTSSSIPWTIR